MKILMASTEWASLARTGALGDAVESLAAELAARGHQVSVALPLYRAVRENKALPLKRTGVSVTVNVGGKRMGAEIFEARPPGKSGAQVFLIARDEYFDRSGLYGPAGSETAPTRSYDDNAERFVFFSRAVVELARHLNPAPDVLHAHDWPAALIPAVVREQGLPFGTVLTIHNLAYQGSFWGVDFGLTNLPRSFFSADGLEFHGRLNFLKGGIAFADAVTTASERYSRDIQTPEHGCGLDGVLRAHARKLVGILPGADYKKWNPAFDKALPARYTPENLAGKQTCRRELLRQLELAPDPQGPVLALVGPSLSALSEPGGGQNGAQNGAATGETQDGLGLLMPLLDRLLSDDVRLILAEKNGEPGAGNDASVSANAAGNGGANAVDATAQKQPSPLGRELLIAARKYPGKFAVRREVGQKLLHRLLAGADALLLPTGAEPGGQTAMAALKYGTPPIALSVGGLHQIVQDYDPTRPDAEPGAGNGFVFYEPTPAALWDTLLRARQLFASQPEWRQLQRRAMAADFSWPSAAEKFEKVYESVKK